MSAYPGDIVGVFGDKKMETVVIGVDHHVGIRNLWNCD